MTTLRWAVATCAVLLAGLVLGRSLQLQQPARGTLLFHNGEIITLSEASGEAVLVVDGVIAEVGRFDELEAKMPRGTEVVDLEGRVLMPGLIEPHTHPDLVSLLAPMVDLSPYANEGPEEVWQRLSDAIASARPGEWVLAQGFDADQMPDLRAPDLDELNRLAPNNPLYIVSQNLHSAWANSLALQGAGITAETVTPNPDSYFEKDAEGNLTGYIHEVDAVKMMNPVLSETIDIVSEAQTTLQRYAAQGITTIATTGLFGVENGALDLFEHYSADDPSGKLRIAEFLGMLPKREPAVRHFIYLLEDSRAYLPASPENGDDFFGVLGVKFWADGSMLEAIKGHRSRTYPEEELGRLIEDLHADGWQIAVHANEAWAVDEALTHFANAQARHPGTDPRHRIEHVGYLSEASARQAFDIGASLSFQMNVLYYYEDLLTEGLDDDALHALYPVRRAHDAGNRVSLHSDAPAFPQSPLHLLEIATAREGKNGMVLGADQAIDRRTALEAITINAAHHLKMEDRIGSITPGKYADLVILDANPLTVPAEDLGTIGTHRTYVAGRLVFDRTDAAAMH